MDATARLDRVLTEAIAAGVGSAAALSIGDGGAEVERIVVGHAARVPTLGPAIDAGVWWDVASLTKPMASGALAMALVSEGRLDLDAAVRAWLPTAASPGTVRQLLGHAAGCAAHVKFFERLRAGCDDPRATLVAMAAGEPLIGRPGIDVTYSDLGYITLGAVLERAAGLPLEDAVARWVTGPLGLGARFAGAVALDGAVATELDDRGVVSGRVHDENAYFGGGVCGHAGLFATIDDVARFAAAIVDAASGVRRGAWDPAVVRMFLDGSAAPDTSWRLGWDTPSATPGVSHAGDRWPRVGAVGHTGFTGTSLWLDLPRRRWVALLTNRVHPTRERTADAIKALRRAVGDAAVAALGA
jgi:CubicO group peptidase (beta-lactamase class C family)